MLKIKLNGTETLVDPDKVVDKSVLYAPVITKSAEEFSVYFDKYIVCKDPKKLETLPKEMKNKMKKEDQVLVYPEGSTDDSTSFLVTLRKGVCDEFHKKECLELFKLEFENMAKAVDIAIGELEE